MKLNSIFAFLLIISGLTALAAFGLTSIRNTNRLEICSENEGDQVKVAIWSSIKFPILMSRGEFLTQIKIEKTRFVSFQNLSKVVRCSAILTAANDSSLRLPFSYQSQLDGLGRPIKIAAWTNYQRDFVPFVFSLEHEYMQQQRKIRDSFGKELKLAEFMMGDPRTDPRRVLEQDYKKIDDLFPMDDDIQIEEKDSPRTPESLIDQLLLPQSYLSMGDECNENASCEARDKGRTLKLIVEFVIEGNGTVSSARQVYSNTGHIKMDSLIIKAAKEQKFSAVDGGPVTVRYTLVRKNLEQGQ